MLKKLVTKINQFKNSFIMLFLLPSVSFAAEPTGLKLTAVIENITKYLTNDLARSAGVLAIVGSGYLYLVANKIEKETFMKIAIALAIILGGPTIYDMLVGK